MLADIDRVRQTAKDVFLAWFFQQTWTKEFPVGYLVSRVVHPERAPHGQEIEGFPLNKQMWPRDRKYDAVARGKLAVSIREGMDSLTIVTDHPWLLRSGDCRWGGAVRITPLECRTQIWVAFSGLTVEEDIQVAQKYGEILLRLLNERALMRLSALDAAGASNGGSFLP